MRSRLTLQFRTRYRKLPDEAKLQARRAYRLWRTDSYHPSLQFKQIRGNVYSARVGLHWRVVGAFKRDTDGEIAVLWFWIGSHAEYDALLKRL